MPRKKTQTPGAPPEAPEAPDTALDAGGDAQGEESEAQPEAPPVDNPTAEQATSALEDQAEAEAELSEFEKAVNQAAEARVNQILGDNESLQGMIDAAVNGKVAAIQKAAAPPPEPPTSAKKPVSVAEAHRIIKQITEDGGVPRPVLSTEGWIVPNVQLELPEKVRLS